MQSPLERKTSVACPRCAMGRAFCVLGIILAVPLALAQPKPVVMQVIMVDYSFDPDHLTFEHDVHYQLHLENHGKETHEFTAPTFLATATIDNPDVLNREHTEVLVDPGESKDLFLTPHRAGTYDLRCADHDWNGMVGGITVK